MSTEVHQNSMIEDASLDPVAGAQSAAERITQRDALHGQGNDAANRGSMTEYSFFGDAATADPERVVREKSPEERFKDLQEITSMYLSPEDEDMLARAFTFASKAHKGQKRKSGEAFIAHPLEVAIILADLHMDVETICAAILHDTVEDSDVTLEQVSETFNESVASLVDGVTKITRIEVENLSDEQAQTIRKMLVAMNKDIRVVVIKLADRLHNMRTLESMPPEKQLKIASETSYFYVPFAHRLGLYTIKSELEDYAMRYTDPTDYYAIAARMKETEEERAALIADFVKPIQESLEANGIHAEVSSRTKSICSIHQKILRKKVNFDDIYDIFAVRFVFDSPVDEEFEICWRIYKIVYDLFLFC